MNEKPQTPIAKAVWNLVNERAKLAAENKRLREKNERLREALEKIATVNAMDYEYVRWAKAALRREET